jgi:microcystin-dependent protein
MEYLSASDARDSLGLGTAAVEGVGTAPGNVVQLDEEGKLPAVDGSALTGLGVVAPGTVLAFAGSTPPEGYLECDGAALSRTAYAALYAAIGTAFGAGDGSTTFNLPDLRGEFVRGWDHGRGVDAGRALGSAQADALQNITGAVTGVVMSGASAASGAFAATLTQSGIINGGTSWTHKTLTLDASSVARTASETRPRNVALMFIIKY